MTLNDLQMRVFEDGVVRIVVPAYLRRKAGSMFFKAPKGRRADQKLLTLGILPLKDQKEANEIRRAYSIVRAGDRPDATVRVERQGPSDWVPNGYEVLLIIDGKSGRVLYDYAIVFPRGGKELEVRAIGDGPLDGFVSLFKTVVDGVEVKAEGEKNSS